MKKLTRKKIKQILIGSKAVSIKEINDLVWGNKWEGNIDPTALRERLRDLLEAEEDLKCLTKQVQMVKKFFSYNSGD